MLIRLGANRGKVQLRRALWRPRIGFEIRSDNLLARFAQKFEKRSHVELVMPRSVWREILFRQFEESDRRPQASAVFCMRWVFEIFLEMNESTRSLDQALEKNVVVGVAIEPKMLEHIVGFVVALIVPAPKISAVERMIRDLAGKIGIVALEFANELRNSFAFAHEGLNFSMPQMMGKPTFPEGPDKIRRRSQE